MPRRSSVIEPAPLSARSHVHLSVHAHPGADSFRAQRWNERRIFFGFVPVPFFTANTEGVSPARTRALVTLWIEAALMSQGFGKADTCGSASFLAIAMMGLFWGGSPS